MKKLMNMKYKLISICYLFLVSFLVLTPTYAKYSTTTYGEAGRLVFSDLKFETGTFTITDDLVFDSNSNVKEEIKDVPKWGSNSEADEDFNLDSLKDVEFSVSNISNVDLLVNFYVEFKMNDVSGFISSYEATIKNLITGDTLEGNVSFTKGEVVSTGFLGAKTYRYYGNIDPSTLTPTSGENINTVIERSFVVYADGADGLTSASYQVTMDFSNLTGSSGWIDNLFGTSSYTGATGGYTFKSGD